MKSTKIPALATRVGRACLYRRHVFAVPRRHLTCTSRRAQQQHQHKSESQSQSQSQSQSHQSAWQAWRSTKLDWKPIPIGLGIAFLGLFQLYRIQRREDGAADNTERPPPRPRIYPDGGGWQVSLMSTLPLKAISRLWGRFNELTIPYALRVPGFHLYGWIFGVNFDEIAEPDLHVFPNLAAFFYRELKPGVRPIDGHPNALVSPADSKVLHFGTVADGQVEQVKGMTYELDALLGHVSPSSLPVDNGSTSSKSTSKNTSTSPDTKADQEFARVNGISYTLPALLSRPEHPSLGPARDASTKTSAASEDQVSAELASSDSSGSPASSRWWSPFSSPTSPTRLYYIVEYLAPGDYHRFHSPASWVATSRRHFAGELYSVSPYVQNMLPGLFTINERVVLLGRWKYGFFSFVPVGATNVGSIKINFDRELRTNSLTTDTEADRQADLARQQGLPYSGFSEATYAAASSLLHGQALLRGQEIGGFQLGSSIVLVFEAPTTWTWTVQPGQTVKVGQRLGWVPPTKDSEST